MSGVHVHVNKSSTSNPKAISWFCQILLKNKFSEIVVKLPATHCSCYELEISWEKIFVAMLRLVKSVKIFNLKNFRLCDTLVTTR